MKFGVSALSLFVRRFPFEAGRWRIIPYALQQCRRNVTTPTIRTISTRHGFRMRLDVSDWLGSHVYVTGEYETATAAVIKACLKRSGSFIDVGANYGYFTLFARTCVGPEGRVFSFEPLPNTRQSLLTNLQLNGMSTSDVYDQALSNQEGEAEFFEGPAVHSGVSSLRRIDDSRRTIRVRTARLDDVIDSGQNVDLIKIDVEGGCHVLEGMPRTLTKWSPDIVFEVTPKYLSGLGRTTGDIDRILSTNGYRCYAIEHEGLRPIPSLDAYPSDQFNAFATAQASVPNGIPVLKETAQ